MLRQGDASPWPKHPGQRCHRQIDKIVAAIGLDPDATMYSLRHSSITRMLLKSVPIRLVASLHNTSVKMIEASYAKHITEHGDEHARAALLHHDELAPVADNVVAISGR